MLVGADVTHPSPDATKAPSIAAVMIISHCLFVLSYITFLLRRLFRVLEIFTNIILK